MPTDNIPADLPLAVELVIVALIAVASVLGAVTITGVLALVGYVLGAGLQAVIRAGKTTARRLSAIYTSAVVRSTFT